jgi:apolipoprotein N-acyltransferase
MSAFGGVLMFLGWAGFGIWPLALVALVPLWAALELAAERSWKTALGIGWVYGTVATAGGYHWMFEFSQLFSGFGLAANLSIFAAFSAYLGLQYAIQAVLYVSVRARGWSVAVAALPTFIVTEWLFPKLFPTYLSNALMQQTLLVQAADLGGPLLVSALAGVINLAVLEVLLWWLGRRASPTRGVATASACVALALLYGALRISQMDAAAESAPSLDVGLVQVNMGVFEKHEQMLEAHARHLEQSRAFERDGPLDLLIWPESAYNYPRFGRSLPILAKEVRQSLKSPLLFGGLSVTRESGYRQLYNSVYLVDQDGIIGEGYDKTRLVMFGEYLPLGDRFPRLYMLSPNTGMFAPGKRVAPLSLGPWRISTPVCYEAILPDLIRDMVREGDPHILINLTNDAWFGDTQEPRIHLRLAQFRAIEHRRYLIRATNSGISAVVDPAGRIVAATGVGTREQLRATVCMLDGQTVYGRLGDWPGWASLLITALMLVRRRRDLRAAPRWVD